MLIPQPAAPKADLAVASAVGDAGISTVGGAIANKPISLEMSSVSAGTTAPAAETTKKKGGSKLVFTGEDVDDEGEELSMEEVRMRVPRYWNMIKRAMEKKKDGESKKE
jgi:hypothetical protein